MVNEHEILKNNHLSLFSKCMRDSYEKYLLLNFLLSSENNRKDLPVSKSTIESLKKLWKLTITMTNKDYLRLNYFKASKTFRIFNISVI